MTHKNLKGCFDFLNYERELPKQWLARIPANVKGVNGNEVVFANLQKKVFVFSMELF